MSGSGRRVGLVGFVGLVAVAAVVLSGLPAAYALAQNVAYAGGVQGAVTYADGGTQSWSYFPDRRLAQSDGRGGETTGYEPGGGVTVAALTRPDDSASTTTGGFYLDGLPRSVSTDGDSTVSSYDGLGNPAAVTHTPSGGSGSTLTTSYNKGEAPTSVDASSYGVGTVTSVFDKLGRPVTTSWAGASDKLTRSWAADSTLTGQVLTSGGSGVAAWAYGYDGDYRQTAASTSGPGGTAPSLAGACPGAGSGTVAAGVSCYRYDTAGRITGYADDQAARTISWDHDSNRTGYGPTGGASATNPTTTETYNADDSVASITTTTGTGTGTGSGTTTRDTYLPFGGLSSDGCASYSYDGYDHQTDAKVGAGAAAACGKPYEDVTVEDALGRDGVRTDTSTDAAGAATTSTTALGYDGTSGQIVSENTTAASGPAATVGVVAYADTAAGVLAVSKNGSGSGSGGQVLVWDPDGNLVAAAAGATLACALRYDPFGGPTHVDPGQGTGVLGRQQCTNAGGSTLSDQRYQGAQQAPGSGSYRQGGRTYQPGSASWTSPDTADQSTGDGVQSIGVDPLTRNTYSYVNGDPLNDSDPSGHQTNDPLDHYGAESIFINPALWVYDAQQNEQNNRGFWKRTGESVANSVSGDVSSVANLANDLSPEGLALKACGRECAGARKETHIPTYHPFASCHGTGCGFGKVLEFGLALAAPGAIGKVVAKVGEVADALRAAREAAAGAKAAATGTRAARAATEGGDAARAAETADNGGGASAPGSHARNPEDPGTDPAGPSDGNHGPPGDGDPHPSPTGHAPDGPAAEAGAGRTLNLPFRDPELSGQVNNVVGHFDEFGAPPSGVAQGGLKGYPKGTYGNKSGALPQQELGYYTESDIYPSGGDVKRGAERLIFGGDGEVWFTPDHYDTFFQIR